MEWERKLDRDWDGVGEGVGWSGKESGMELEREWDGVGERVGEGMDEGKR